MESTALYPFAHYWWFYGLFMLFVLGLLALDLGVFHRQAHEVGFREALAWGVVWVTLALIFSYVLYLYSLWKFPEDTRLMALPGFDPEAMAKQSSLEFLTGFVIEKSLAVDNIFVFVVVFSFFAIPSKYQHRVLFFGIIGALIFRIIFVAAGSVLMQYHLVVWFFGALLMVTGLKILLAPPKPVDLSKNPIIKLLRKFARITPELEGQRFLVQRNGLTYVTPLFVALVFIELSDIIFAVDSVPAIFAITNEPLIVLTSNVFAILGLRAMYFLLAGVVERFRYLKYGLGAVLILVGLKMVWLNEAFGGKFPIAWSLGIIGSILITSVVVSLWCTRSDHLPSDA